LKNNHFKEEEVTARKIRRDIWWKDCDNTEWVEITQVVLWRELCFNFQFCDGAVLRCVQRIIVEFVSKEE